jgi:hypothetical protein
MKVLHLTRFIAATALLSTVTVAGGATLASASGSTTITVAFPSVYAFDTGPLATKWWNQVKADW